MICGLRLPVATHQCSTWKQTLRTMSKNAARRMRECRRSHTPGKLPDHTDEFVPAGEVELESPLDLDEVEFAPVSRN